MFKIGDIVCHEEIVFNDNSKDVKSNRPCVVIGTIINENEEFVVTCPLTSSINQFNKYPKTHWLMPCVVYSFKKLCFAKIDTILIKRFKETKKTNINIGNNLAKELKNKIIDYYKNNNIEYCFSLDSIQERPKQIVKKK